MSVEVLAVPFYEDVGFVPIFGAIMSGIIFRKALRQIVVNRRKLSRHDSHHVECGPGQPYLLLQNIRIGMKFTLPKAVTQITTASRPGI